MNDNEALEIFYGWLAHLDSTRNRSIKMQELASKARKSPEDAKEAQKEMRQLQGTPRVYDGARLETAVRHIIKRLK